MEQNNNLKIVYRLNTSALVGIVIAVFVAITFMSDISRQLSYSQQKYYDPSTGEIITPGYYPSSFPLTIALIIACVVVVIIGLIRIRIGFYEIVCPHCNKVTYIRTNLQGADCEACGKRIIIDNNLPIETNANSQESKELIDELERQKEIKKKTWKIGLIVFAVFTVLIFGITLIGIINM